MLGIPIAGVITAIVLVVIIMAVAPLLASLLHNVTVWIDFQEEKTQDAWKGDKPSKQDEKDS